MVSQDSDALVDHLVSELGISKEDVLVAHSTDSAHLKEGHCPGVLTNNYYLFVHLIYHVVMDGICFKQSRSRRSPREVTQKVLGKC